jgi:N-acetylglucosamine kinase-like BadF-type ATPase
VQWHEQLVLGVDGGGTKTVAWLAPLLDQEAAIGHGAAGPGNPRAVGFEAAAANIDAAIEAAFRAAGIERSTVAAACLALAGAGRADVQTQMTHWATERGVAASVRVGTDAEAVLAAASGRGPGIALICGTGSMAWGRDAQGITARAGGWGYLLGDEGSAYAISLAGLQAAARAADGRGSPTALLPRFQERLDAAAPADLVERVYAATMSRDRLAALADTVFHLADTDEVAAKIIEHAAGSLAECVASVAGRLQFTPNSFALAFAGSTILRQESYQRGVLSQLQRLDWPPAQVTAVEEPVAGAVAMARQMSLGNRP